MIDPSTMLLAGATFVASSFARHVTDDAIKTAWERIKTAINPILSREPVPEDLAEPAVAELLQRDPDVAAAMSAYWAQSAVLRRAKVVSAAVDGARILWVDDFPLGNALERRTLEALGAGVCCVESLERALGAAQASPFDLLLSDIARPSSPMAGLEQLPAVTDALPGVPVIFYVGRLSSAGVPPGAFGITNRPDELLHLCFDALERRRL
jgi:hypothetical protein